MIKAVIIDDDIHCRESLKTTIASAFDNISVIAECKSADEGKKAILELNPELVFLDVEMPDKTGFDLISELSDKAYDLDIIFTTAHERYALQAIKASALDFLLKPIGEHDLREALTKLDRKRTKDQVAQQIQVLLQHYTNDPYRKIALPTQTGFVFVNVNDVVRCEADNVYTTFFMTDKTKIVVSKTLKDCEGLLPEDNFFRVHHSHLINVRYIKEYIKGEGGMVKMVNDNELIPVSRNKKEEFLERIKH